MSGFDGIEEKKEWNDKAPPRCPHLVALSQKRHHRSESTGGRIDPTSLMPCGKKHRGQRMDTIPLEYMAYCYANREDAQFSWGEWPQVHSYFERHLLPGYVDGMEGIREELYERRQASIGRDRLVYVDEESTPAPSPEPKAPKPTGELAAMVRQLELDEGFPKLSAALAVQPRRREIVLAASATAGVGFTARFLSGEGVTTEFSAKGETVGEAMAALEDELAG